LSFAVKGIGKKEGGRRKRSQVRGKKSEGKRERRRERKKEEDLNTAR
jgi:hypothetical protein